MKRQIGATGEVTVAVIDTCENAISPARERVDQQERKACQSKYALKEGTMYRSAAAFCEAEVAVKYAEKSAHS